MPHTKPTKEELEAQARQALEEAQKPETPEPPKEEEKVPEPETTPEKQEEQPEPEEKETQSDIDYRKKFAESTREAQVLHAKNKKLNEAIELASTVPEVTEQELQAEYSDWENMTELEKRMAKSSLMNERRFQALQTATKEFKDIDAWTAKVDQFISDANTLVVNPELEGKVEEFKVFATKASRRGVDFPDLVSAFLFQTEKGKPVKKGKMFESGTSGPNATPKPPSDKISLADAQVLMKQDYNKYKSLLKAGKIDLNSI